MSSPFVEILAPMEMGSGASHLIPDSTDFKVGTANEIISVDGQLFFYGLYNGDRVWLPINNDSIVFKSPQNNVLANTNINITHNLNTNKIKLYVVTSTNIYFTSYTFTQPDVDTISIKFLAPFTGTVYIISRNSAGIDNLVLNNLNIPNFITIDQNSGVATILNQDIVTPTKVTGNNYLATQTTNGTLSATDKTKIDNLPVTYSNVLATSIFNYTATPSYIPNQSVSIAPGQTVNIKFLLGYTTNASTTGMYYGFTVNNQGNGQIYGTYHMSIQGSTTQSTSEITYGGNISQAGGQSVNYVISSTSASSSSSCGGVTNIVLKNAGTTGNITVSMYFYLPSRKVNGKNYTCMLPGTSFFSTTI